VQFSGRGKKEKHKGFLKQKKGEKGSGEKKQAGEIREFRKIKKG